MCFCPIFTIRNSGRITAVFCRRFPGADPDAVFIGGDMMVAKGTADLSVSLALLSQLAKRVSGLLRQWES